MKQVGLDVASTRCTWTLGHLDLDQMHMDWDKDAHVPGLDALGFDALGVEKNILNYAVRGSTSPKKGSALKTTVCALWIPHLRYRDCHRPVELMAHAIPPIDP